LSFGAKHWYWDLINTETDEIYGYSESVLEKENLKDGINCMLRKTAIRKGVDRFIQLTYEGLGGVLIIGRKNAVKHGIEIEKSWREKGDAV
jgi:hypothetical protein